MILEKMHAMIWGVPVLTLIIGVGIWLSLRTGFLQIRLLPRALSSLLQKQPRNGRNGDISSFQALCTALAATVGTGNIAGVAGAIILGGPGAIFWMWISAFLGMILKFAEAVLCVRFRKCDSNGFFYGGPMHMITSGLPSKWHFLAGIYAFFGAIAAFGVGNATQINACITSLQQAAASVDIHFGMDVIIPLAIVVALLVAYTQLGGASRVGKLSQWIIPFCASGYIILCMGILLLRLECIPYAFRSIFRGAFSPEGITGGAVGSCMLSLRIGISRGIFTNEAGMGTAGIAHAGASVSHPVEQGLMGILEVFLDTLVICTMTALVILCSGVSIPYGNDIGAQLTNQAFLSVYGEWVMIPMVFFLCSFAFATMIGWGMYGIRCAQFLFGKGAARYFVALQCVVTVVSVCLRTGTVWLLADIVNGLMAIPNLFAILLLSPVLLQQIFTFQIKNGS